MKHAIRLGVILLSALLLSGMGATRADSELRYNQVQLTAQQGESVGNDTLHVTMAVNAEERDPARLAQQINGDMEWALAIARQQQTVTAATGSYQTWQVYRDNVQKGWRGQQNLMLEGKDTELLARLVGRLQEKLQVSSMHFSVSDDKRMAVENRLIRAALDAYKTRAGIVVDNLQAKGYRIVDININTSAQRPPPMPYQARMSAKMEDAAPVAVEAGESDINVTVSGTIELQLP